MPDGSSHSMRHRAADAAAPGLRLQGAFPRLCNGGCVPYGAIVHHIRQNLARRITLDELARIACIGVFQLSRAFRRDLATTPYRLVLEERIRHAADMLEAGATIAETASHTGCADQSHFTRHFKRLTGTTPKRYAAWRMREGPAAGAVRAAGHDPS
jgi:AraC-like DNA-binding protein